MDLNIPPYMDDWKREKAKGYIQLLGHPGRISQARELTTLQSLLIDRISSLARTLYVDGQVLRGCFLTVSKDKRLATISPGVIYVEGSIIEFTDYSTLAIAGQGVESIGIICEEEVVDAVQDPDLRDPHVGYSNYNEAGADRLKQVWYWERNPQKGYGVFLLKDGVVVSTVGSQKLQSDTANPQQKPEIQNVLDIIARRDYEQFGNFVVSGLRCRLIEHPVYPKDRKQLVVEAGTARIRGYDVSIISDVSIDFPVSRGTDEILDEPWEYKPYDPKTKTGGQFTLGERPVARINRVTATVLVVDGWGGRPLIVRGQIPGGSDELREQSVVSIVAVNQGGEWDPVTETFVGGVTFPPTSYEKDGNNIRWSPQGPEPLPGSSYAVAYKYRKHLKKQIVVARQVINERIVHNDSQNGDKLAHSYLCERNNNTQFTFIAVRTISGQPPSGVPGVDFLSTYKEGVDFEILDGGYVDWYTRKVKIVNLIHSALNGQDVIPDLDSGYTVESIIDVAYYVNEADIQFDDDSGKFVGATVSYQAGTDYAHQKGTSVIDWSLGGSEPSVNSRYVVAVSARRYRTYNHPAYNSSYFVSYYYWEVVEPGDYLARDSFYLRWYGVDDRRNEPVHYGLDYENVVNFWRSSSVMSAVGNIGVPYPGTLVEVDYEYYVPRYALVEYNQNDPIAIRWGEASRKPVEPVYVNKEDCIFLAKVWCPADSLDMILTELGVRTLKVHDLHDIKDRVVRTELNLALTWLDLDAKSIPVANKKGIMTTAFSNDSRIDRGWPNTQYSIDPGWEQLALPHDDQFYSIEIDEDITDAKVYSKIATLVPSGSEVIEQPYETRDESIAPYAVYDQDNISQSQSAYMILRPASDTLIIPRTVRIAEGDKVNINPYRGGISRRGHTAILVDGNIYYWGGYSSEGRLINSMDVFSVGSRQWSVGSSGGTPRAYHVCFYHNSKIYFWGGVTPNGESNTCDIFDITSGTWSQGPAGGRKRQQAAFVVYGGILFIWGGIADGTPVNTLDMYDIHRGVWYTGASGGKPRYGAVAGAYDGKIYVWGGKSDSYENKIDIYTISTNSWSEGNAGGTPRANAAGVVHGTHFLVWGGINDGGVVNTLDVYWITSGLWGLGISGGTARHSHSAVAYGDQIYFWGGSLGPRDSQVVNTTEIYDAGLQSWHSGVQSVRGLSSLEEATAWIMSDVSRLSNPTRWFSKGWTGGTETRKVFTGKTKVLDRYRWRWVEINEDNYTTITTESSKQKEVLVSEYIRDIQGNCRQLEVSWEIPGFLIKGDRERGVSYHLYFGGIRVTPKLTNGTPEGAVPGTFYARPHDRGASGTFLIPPNVPEGRIEVRAISDPLIGEGGRVWNHSIVAIYDASVVEKVTVEFERCRCNCWCHCVCNCWNCRSRCGTGPLAQTLEPIGKLRFLKSISLVFTKVHPNFGVFGCIVKTENGTPTSNTVSTGMIARKFLGPQEMAGGGRKIFEFEDPVCLRDEAYAIVVTGEDEFNINAVREVLAGNDIRCSIAVLGEKDKKSGLTVGSQPFVRGMLWRSLTGVTWEQDQRADITFSAVFNLYPTDTWQYVYTKPISVEKGTAFICNWDSEVFDGTSIVFEYKVNQGVWTEFSPYQLVYLQEVASELRFRAKLKTSLPNVTPYVSVFGGLYVQSTRTQLYVVTKQFVLDDPATKLDVYLDSHLPPNCSQRIRVTFDNGVSWITLNNPVNGTIAGNLVEYTCLNSNEGQEEYRHHWTISVDVGQAFTEYRVEISAQASGANAELKDPRFSRLVTIASV